MIIAKWMSIEAALWVGVAVAWTVHALGMPERPAFWTFVPAAIAAYLVLVSRTLWSGSSRTKPGL